MTDRDGAASASLLDAILRTHGLPEGFVAVARVESGLNPQALSPKGARGLWQLMSDTARRYGLVVGTNRDDRLDPLKSTRAAATYLQDLYGRFRDWPLALAAYNAGENRVRRVVERSGGGDFWKLSRRGALPGETRPYVPAVLSSLKYWTPAESVLPRPLDGKPADESETTLGELHSYGPSGHQPGEGVPSSAFWRPTQPQVVFATSSPGVPAADPQ